ncbi:uncharacterized protein LOC120262507 isoform X1 [Dioscorea cayenensis subsp. rotundata]|uniref:Uncharacterized protein LOC120262507 isoform X1 n=1 Tax=Dioscorea cayennensis subsp. rotundata TaxID=55577 RepID=A0AB40BHM5_DIOCR|nr:uncharacterized protein LOC120262507 isoform X1 [Dioscorea cayenensis subsp. rotundata]
MSRLIIMFILILYLFVSFSSQTSYAGIVENKEEIISLLKMENKVIKMHGRKVLMDMIMDYEYGGPNSKHDPRRARPGMAGRNN